VNCDAEPVLSDRQYNILQAMLELKAVTADGRRSTAEIASIAEGRVDPARLKGPIADLEKRGLIGTKTGAGGGCWLTAKGFQIAQKLGEKR
jgi:DNA-binding IscR family transcriptional regulator